MTEREKSNVAWEAAYFIREASVMLGNIGEADLSADAASLERRVTALEQRLEAEADRAAIRARYDMDKLFERSVI